MKKILYLLMLAVFVFSCSSDKAVVVKDTADNNKQISKKNGETNESNHRNIYGNN